MTILKKGKSYKMHERTTKCICHKGFSGYSSVVARSNFRVHGQETTTRSLTAHTQTVTNKPKEKRQRHEN